MKKVLFILLAMSLILALVPASLTMAAPKADPNLRGNDLPKGKTYNFNIIGVPNQKNWDPDSYDTGGQGKRIFVLRSGMTQFYVYGDDETAFEILDRDGTDGKVGMGVGEPGITFPYDETSDTWQAAIYVRILGPMDENNKIDGVTKYDYSGGAWLEEKTWTWRRGKPSKFSLKTDDLLVDGYQDILWEMTPGDKFRICQVRVILFED